MDFLEMETVVAPTLGEGKHSCEVERIVVNNDRLLVFLKGVTNVISYNLKSQQGLDLALKTLGAIAGNCPVKEAIKNASGVKIVIRVVEDTNFTNTYFVRVGEFKTNQPQTSAELF